MASLTSRRRSSLPAGLRGARGQIALFLLLVVVVALVFAMATANLGVASTTALRLANASDAAALNLGSQLATKANTLWVHGLQRLEPPEICVKKGIAQTVMSVVGAIAGVILAPFTFGGSLLLAIIGGAIGGAAGGWMMQGSLRGALMGAIQGAMIGAAIGGGYMAGTNILQGFATAAGNSAQAAALAAGASIATASEAAAATAGAVMAYAPAAAGTGAALAVGSKIYNATVEDRMTSNAVTAAMKALNGLPVYEQMREGIFLGALSQAVDDPNNTIGQCYWPDPTPAQGDRNDSDGDGETTKPIPCFQQWWDDHIRNLKAQPGMASSEGIIGAFLRNQLQPFARHAEGFLREFDRGEVECSLCSGADAPAVGLWRALTVRGAHLPFWSEGPNRADLLRWYRSACADCPLPNGFDEVDGARQWYEHLIDFTGGLSNPTRELRDLDATSQEWMRLLYDPANDADIYHALESIAAAIERWVAETERVRDQLPNTCQLAYGDHPLSRSAPPSCGQQLPYSEAEVYPCNWAQQTSRATGTYVPNAACRIDAGRRQTLTGEIGRVSGITGNGEQRLREQFLGSRPCQQFGAGWEVEGSPTISARAELNRNRLSYTAEIRYTCQGEVCGPPARPGGPPTCHPGSASPPARTVSDALSIEAPDLTIPNLSLADFNQALADFQRILDQPNAIPFATLDQDIDDEFQEGLGNVRTEPAAIRNFLAQARNFHAEMQRSHQGRGDTGQGTVSYQWRDSRGDHTVTAETGPFRLPAIENEEREVGSMPSWFMRKECQVLRFPNDGAWVRLRREDPSPQGRFWTWNPFHRPIAKRACASFNYKEVGLQACP